MKCLLVPTNEVDNGRRKHVCKRGCLTNKGQKILWVPLKNMIQEPGECTALPLVHEYREWIRLFADAFGYSQAKAICEFIRWRFRGSKLDEIPKAIPQPRLPPLTEGPGTELKKIFDSLGIQPKEGCKCQQRLTAMNRWGPQLCRENRATILEILKASYDEASVLAKLRAAANAVSQGLPITLAGLLDLAIERAEQRS